MRILRSAATVSAGLLVAATVLVTGGAPASAGAAGALGAACGKTAPDLDGSSYTYAARTNANMRSGSSSTACGIVALLTTEQLADYHCYTVGSDGYTWTHLRAHNTDYGWVRDDLLKDNGSDVYCGF